jgi:ribonuclease HI
MIILMADGSSKGNPGPIQIGFLVWDRTKDPREMKPVYRHSEFKGAGTNNEAEWMAVIEGIKWISRHINLKSEELYIYSDSQLVIRQMNGEYAVRHPNVVPYFEEFKTAVAGMKGMHRCSVQSYWIPRQLTGMADTLATRPMEGASR